MVCRVEYDQLVKYIRMWTVQHRVWCGCVTYRNQDWDLLQLWNFWVGILYKNILGSNGMVE